MYQLCMDDKTKQNKKCWNRYDAGSVRQKTRECEESTGCEPAGTRN